MNRISRDEFLMRFAMIAALRGTCNRLSVGAIIANDGRVISLGYVGSPPGMPHCIDAGCLIEDDHCIRTIHAEQNALLFAARNGIATKGCELFVTHSPCGTCVKSVITAGIKRVVYAIRYGDADLAEQQMKQSEIIIEWYRSFSKDVARRSEVKEEHQGPEVPALPTS